jgi:hypothetical protein
MVTCKVTLLQVFYLSEAPSPPMTPWYVYTIYLITYGRGGGELTKEKVRGAIDHKAARKYQHDLPYLQSINSIKHQ